MSSIQRIGDSPRWSDIVIHNGVAQWVEVANDMTADTHSQIAQVLSQIDDTLTQIGSSRERLLQILIYLADLEHSPTLNELWDAWVPPRSRANSSVCAGWARQELSRRNDHHCSGTMRWLERFSRFAHEMFNSPTTLKSLAA